MPEQDGISTIIVAIVRSRKIFRRLESYIIYRIASSLLILGFFFLAILIYNFEIPTWAIVVISICNDLSVMATSVDKVCALSSDRCCSCRLAVYLCLRRHPLLISLLLLSTGAIPAGHI